MRSHNSPQLWRTATQWWRTLFPSRGHLRAASLTVGLIAVAAWVVIPGSGAAAGKDGDDAMLVSPACRDGRTVDSRGNPCATTTPSAQQAPRPSIARLKLETAYAYNRFIHGDATKEEFLRYEAQLAEATRENIGSHDWSSPDGTPAGLRLRGIAPAHDYGPLVDKFWPFKQITWWYCGPATAQSILWFLGPHRSESYDEAWGGRPWLVGDAQADQWLLANDFWLATNRYEGTNWGERYMPFTLNAWRGSFWYVQAATPRLGGSLNKQDAEVAMQYAFDRSYPVAENVLYAPHTYYPYGFWPGVTYQHWDVAHGFVTDIASGDRYVRIGQVYHDERIPYERFQKVLWDVHWTAIGSWHGIVW